MNNNNEVVKYENLNLTVGMAWPVGLSPKKCANNFELQANLFKKLGIPDQLFSNEIYPVVKNGKITKLVKRDRVTPFPMIDANGEKQRIAMASENLHSGFTWHTDTRSHDETVLLALNGDGNLGIDKSEQMGFAGLGK